MYYHPTNSQGELVMNATETKSDRTAQPQEAVTALGLGIDAVFVPFSQSRNRTEKSPSLNWRVTLHRTVSGIRRDILTTDYSAGCGHAPSYKQSFGRKSVEDRERDAMAAWECEHGGLAQGVRYPAGGIMAQAYGSVSKRIEPDTLDVIFSLVMDSDVLDAGGFESWASDFGYDTDSRKTEKTYQVCLDIALKLRVAIGDAGLQQLRTAFQDY
jgi:hypothetical protein